MRKICLLFLVLGSIPVFAVELQVKHPCGGDDWLSTTLGEELPATVGSLTIGVFTRDGLEFVGSERGINQIRWTPVGDAAMEIVSDTEMRAYGWCYAVDGIMPDAMADEVEVSDQSTQIMWFFGYAHYLDGEWVEYCVPTHEVQPDFVCMR